MRCPSFQIVSPGVVSYHAQPASNKRKMVKRKRRPQSAGAEAEEMTAIDAEAESELASSVTTTTAASTTSEAVTATTAATTAGTSTATESDGAENYAGEHWDIVVIAEQQRQESVSKVNTANE